MRTKYIIRNTIAVILVFIILPLFYILFQYHKTEDIGDEVVSILIKSGDGFSVIADSLSGHKAISSEKIFRLMARLRGIDKKLTPGRYDFSGRNSCKSILDKFERAEFLTIKVTIPEGSPIWKTAAIIAERMNLDSALIHSLNTDSVLLSRLDLPYLEGYLFPETYFFPWGARAEDVITEMVRMFRNRTDAVWPDTLPHGLSRKEVIVLASIIEAETPIDSERVIVSSVYLNRLEKRMRLDADPAVIYGLGGLDRPLRIKDLRRDTPYNTYMHKGLPPTPINSPGLACIRAALNPDSTDYLFFVADRTGGHYFSKTNAEHNRARQRIKRDQLNE